jgi:hypothetical protein
MVGLPFLRTQSSTRIPQLGLTESAMHNLSAAKSTGFCLRACIDQRCFEGMLGLDRDGVGEAKSY